MKNFKNLTIEKGTPGRLSEIGEYGYWYPGQDTYYDTEVTETTIAEHLCLWRNQDPWFAFKVPAGNVTTKDNCKGFVCVWFLEKDIIKYKMI